MCHNCKTKDSHDTVDCRKLSKLPYAKQQEIIKEENLCFHCLRKGHGRQKCWVKVKCVKCNEDHATCLHDSMTDSSGLSNSKYNSSVTEEAVSHNIHSAQNSSLTTTILPVYVSSPENPEKETLVYALVDSMSNTSFISADTADYLNAPSSPARLKMSTMTSQNQLSTAGNTLS